MDTNGNKDFKGWISIKENIHTVGRVPDIKEGEIWWCAVGENVGVEINGKNEIFSRPVIVLKKLSKYGFLGVPLTTKMHTGNWHVPFVFQGKNQYASLAQIRVLVFLDCIKKWVWPQTQI